MRIALVIDYFRPHAIGGAERSARELARAFVERGHTVAVLTPNYGAPAEEEDGGVRIFRYWFPRTFEPGGRAPERWIKNPLYYWLSGRAIARIAKAQRIEILHAQNSFVQAPAYAAARRLGLPCVVTIRDLGSLCAVGHLAAVGNDPGHTCKGSFRRCAREFTACYYPNASAGFRFLLKLDLLFKHVDVRLRRRILRRCSRIIFVSHGLKDVYLRHGFDAPADKLEVVYNIPPAISDIDQIGLPPAEWNLPEDAPVVSFVGRMTLGKGADVLLAAIPRVIERLPDVVFVFAGRPSPQVAVPDGIPERHIRCLGRIEPEQAHALLKRSSLLALPSVWPEPLSSAVLEALAFGVPVIGTRRGGTPEQIVDGENGWLINPGDPIALADALTTALSDPNRLRQMPPRCRTMLNERFDSEKILDKMLGIYKAAVATRMQRNAR